MTAGPCVSLAKIELISHDGGHGAYLRASANPRLHTATSHHDPTTSSAVRGDASVEVLGFLGRPRERERLRANDTVRVIDAHDVCRFGRG